LDNVNRASDIAICLSSDTLNTRGLKLIKLFAVDDAEWDRNAECEEATDDAGSFSASFHIISHK
jgi:hypothetical protein